MIRLARKKHYFIVAMILVSFLFTFVVPAFAGEKSEGQGKGSGPQHSEVSAPEPPANGRPEGFTPPGQEKKNPDVQIPPAGSTDGDSQAGGTGGGGSTPAGTSDPTSRTSGQSAANSDHNEGVGQDPEQSNKVTAAEVPIDKEVIKTYDENWKVVYDSTVKDEDTMVKGGDGNRWPGVPVGGYVEYLITVTNKTDPQQTLTSVEISDNHPNTELVESTPLATPGPGNKHFWTATLLPNIPFKITVKVKVPDGAPQTITNEARNEFGSSAVCQVAIIEKESLPPEKKFDLSIAKSVDREEARPGDILIYTINYSNTGNQALTGVVITDTISDKTEFVGIVEGTGSVSDGRVTFTIGDLAAGASGAVKFKVQIKAAAEGTITNVAIIDSDQTGPKSDDASTEITVTPGVTTTPGITTTPPQELKYNIFLLKVVSHETAKPGDILVYALHWANTGNSTLTKVVLADAIPAGTTYIPDSATTDDRAKLNFEGGVLVWRFDKIDPNTSGIYIFNVRINDDTRGVVENTAIIDSDQTDPERSTARTTVVTVAPAVFGPPTAPVLVAAPPAPKKAAALPFTGANLVVYFLTAVFMIGTGVGLQKLK